jgi:hypothetical protein
MERNPAMYPRISPQRRPINPEHKKIPIVQGNGDGDNI